MGNCAISLQKAYTLTVDGKNFPNWIEKERWEGFAKLEREVDGRTEKAIIAYETIVPFSFSEMFNVTNDCIVMRTDCQDLLDALESKSKKTAATGWIFPWS